MKTSFKMVAMLLGVSIFPLCAQAQKKVIIEDQEPNSIMFVSRDKAGDEIIRIMNDRQQFRFQDPNAPRFLLTDQKGKFALGIGGYVRATAEYDFGGIVNDVDFYPALIPQKGNGNFAKNQFQMDISTSTLFLKLVGHTKRLGDFVIYTAGNFRGDGKTFELQNAYAQFLGFTIGYNYGTFMDLSALPPTIDFAGPNGSAFYRTTQLSYMYSKLKNWKLGVAVEMPSVDGTTNNDVSVSTQRMPDFAASAQYNWNNNGHIKLAAIVRSMTYSSAVHNKAFSTTGFGLQASSTFNITKKWQVYGQFNYGKGIGSYLNDLSNLNVDIVPDPENEGKMQVLPMLVGMQVYSITLLRMCLYPEHIVCPDFIPNIIIQAPTRNPIVKDNTSLLMHSGMSAVICK